MMSKAAKPLYKYWTKGARGKSGPPRRGRHWIVARRGFLEFYSDRVVLGNWEIQYSEVTSAVIWQAGAPIIELQTVGEHYQFGLNPWVKLPIDLPLEFEKRSSMKLYSTTNLALRVVVIFLLGALIAWMLS